MAEANPSNGYFSMGLDTLKVPVQLFAVNRKRICEKLKSLPDLPQGSVILLQGGGDLGRCEGDSSDVGPNFRQESTMVASDAPGTIGRVWRQSPEMMTVRPPNGSSTPRTVHSVLWKIGD